MYRMLIKREPDGAPYLARLTHKYAVISKDTTAENEHISCHSFSSNLSINTFMYVDMSKINEL